MQTLSQLALQNPMTGNDNLVVGGGDGTLALYNAELNLVAGKRESLMGSVTSIAAPARDARTSGPKIR